MRIIKDSFEKLNVSEDTYSDLKGKILDYIGEVCRIDTSEVTEDGVYIGRYKANQVFLKAYRNERD